eukprot:scaffold680783_cov74-Prasinocladus_malaysianus.AAC.1
MGVDKLRGYDEKEILSGTQLKQLRDVMIPEGMKVAVGGNKKRKRKTKAMLDEVVLCSVKEAIIPAITQGIAEGRINKSQPVQ